MTHTTVTILGCGTSGGVPSLHKGWGNANPNNPKNHRKRASIAIRTPDSHILIDMGSDLREQLLSYENTDFDAILCTHEHADHIHGIDDLRWVCEKHNRAFPVYAMQRTLDALKNRFEYVFSPLPQDATSYFKPVLEPVVIKGDFCINNTKIIPIHQHHGSITSLGFRLGDFAYCTDVVDFDDSEFEKLQGIKVWVVDALRYAPHPSHAHVDKVLEWAKKLNGERTYFTHMDHTMDYDTLMQDLPDGVAPAYDGLQIIV